MLEKDIESRVVKDLESIGCFVVKFQDLSRKGAPDRLALFKDGHCLFLELKTSVGRLSPHQRDYHSKLLNHGAEIAVVNSLDDWAEMFEDLKIEHPNGLIN